jgi:hypothetical protein
MVQTDEERKAKKKASQKRYRQSEKGKANSKRYSQREDVKENAKRYSQSEKGKATRKQRDSTPEGKAKNLKYGQKPEVKAKKEKYRQDNLEKISKRQKVYDTSDIGKANSKKYEQSEKGKANRKRYDSSEKGKANQMRYNQSHKGNEIVRLKVLKYFSKLHSNSDIPCCRCCGQNSHIDFLNIDHIIGKHDMDSIPELKKLGYSSTKGTATLSRWIIANDYLKDLQTEYFQILCFNCNSAKGIVRNNNECPMKNKPHF